MKVKKSPNADSRTARKDVTKEVLTQDTISHIKDVGNGCKFIANKLIEAGEKHDYTKIDLMDKFYEDFTSGLRGEEFKALGWWDSHKNERHHLSDRVPEDVNLVDVIEMIVDCCMAGMARSGSVHDITIDSKVLQKAVKNTQDLIVKNIEIID